jgi:hypothetical protein
MEASTAIIVNARFRGNTSSNATRVAVVFSRILIFDSVTDRVVDWMVVKFRFSLELITDNQHCDVRDINQYHPLHITTQIVRLRTPNEGQSISKRQQNLLHPRIIRDSRIELRDRISIGGRFRQVGLSLHQRVVNAD